MTHFLSYWRPNTVERVAPYGHVLDHSASGHYGRVKPRDTVWIVTFRNSALWLVGRIAVGQVTDQAGAERHFERDDLWKAKWHIIADKVTEPRGLDLDIQDLAGSLRFESPRGHDRLSFRVDGTVNRQQLQAMRVLSVSSANLLTRRMREAIHSKDLVDPEDEDYTATA